MRDDLRTAAMTYSPRYIDLNEAREILADMGVITYPSTDETRCRQGRSWPPQTTVLH